jgi:multicomponent K+:H+ antiporter subunit F
MILSVALDITFGALVLAMVFCAFRLFRGPSLPDRILALDTLYVNAVGLLLVLGLRQDTQVYFEAALVVALLGFVGTVFLSRYLLGRAAEDAARAPEERP